jgi:hypothetical protein
MRTDFLLFPEDAKIVRNRSLGASLAEIVGEVCKILSACDINAHPATTNGG